MKSKAILKIQEIDFHWEMEDPFLFCAHHEDKYPAGNENQGIDRRYLGGRNIGSDFTIKDGYRMYHGHEVPGFPVHPHRGFETVTIVTEGYVDHFDSLGAYGRYGQGDVQWMTAGKGCQHAEMFPLVHDNKPNPLNLFQIWLNLPKENKFVNPAYKMLWHEDIPVVEEIAESGGRTTVTIIAGRWRDRAAISPAPDSWAADPANHVGIFLVRMQAGGQLTLPAISSTASRNIYYYAGGSIKVDGQEVASSNRIKLESSREIIIENGSADSHLLILEAEPIDEPVVKYGPFVMNTQQQIRDAFTDYQRTQFGGWPYKQEVPVNERTSGRFANFSDGSKEVRKGKS